MYFYECIVLIMSLMKSSGIDPSWNYLAGRKRKVDLQKMPIYFFGCIVLIMSSMKSSGIDPSWNDDTKPTVGPGENVYISRNSVYVYTKKPRFFCFSCIQFVFSRDALWGYTDIKFVII